jgi:hypothetical protein
MKSPVAKRSIIIGGHKTSVSLEEAFWSGMKEIAGARSITLFCRQLFGCRSSRIIAIGCHRLICPAI